MPACILEKLRPTFWVGRIVAKWISAREVSGCYWIVTMNWACTIPGSTTVGVAVVGRASRN